MIACRDVYRIFKAGNIEVVALSGLTMTVARGEYVAILGNSGSGKSTLLNLLGGLDTPTAGSLAIDGRDMLSLTRRERVAFRRHTVGFVWQNPARNLIPYLTALENVELAMMTAGDLNRGRAKDLLAMTGLSKHANAIAGTLSGGQQQRIGVAVALANEPKLLLADEPTSAVDADTAAALLCTLRALQSDLGMTIVMVTHDVRLSKQVDRMIAIRDGRVES